MFVDQTCVFVLLKYGILWHSVAFAIRSGSLNDGQMAMVMTIKAILDEEYQFEPRHCHGQGGTAASSAEFDAGTRCFVGLP